MTTKRYIGLSVLILVLASMAIFLSTSATASAKYGFSLPISHDEAGDFTVAYTRRKMNVLSENLKIMHMQPITSEDLSPLGFPEVKSNHPLALVIIKGDVDISGAWPGADQGNTRYTHINYVFDLEEGEPIAVLAELNDDILKRALDPSLRLRLTDIPRPPEPISEPLPDGVVEPTIKPPDSNP